MNWPGLPEAAALFALTFASEDAAVFCAAVLVAGGMLPWEVGFAACFFGIWLGDLWLYGMARALGVPFVSRFEIVPAVQRSQAWFEKRGSLVLVISRFVPGLRLPAYLAAGAMSFPITAFALLTGIMAAVWVALILAAGRFLGLAQIPWIRDHAIWIAVGALSVAAGTAWGRVLRGPSRTPRKMGWLAWWTQWEFWPAWLFYAPVVLCYLWLALRHRSLTLPAAANPGMPLGGLVGESKFDTLRLLHVTSPSRIAQTWLLEPDSLEIRMARLQAIMARSGVLLPLVLKPDVGQRGVGVKLIKSMAAARDYLSSMPGPILLQRYVEGPREAGVFYVRRPGEERGHIFAITEKVFPVLIGDGVRKLEELILADARASILAETYLRRFESLRGRVPEVGQRIRLVEAGNHAQGCIFRDGGHLATPELEGVIDEISRSIPGFYIGRYDLRYANDDDLRAGRGFQILELNGASAEATSIYDSRNSLFSAYRTLFRQWTLVFEIGSINRARGHRPASLLTIWREWRRTAATIRTYPMAD